LDTAQQFHNPIDDGFGARRAARDESIHWQDLIDVAHDVITILEYTT
jgi:hypothetical protein